MDEQVRSRIQGMVDEHSVLLFMKGSPDFPQCGFSAKVAGILQKHGTRFAAFDVLADPDVRQGIKDFANWPTIPQLYIGGEFVGGCDIVAEMDESGELETALQGANPKA